MKPITELEQVFYLATPGPFHFILLGVGGTGSDLASKLCRHLSLLRVPDTNTLIHDITLCDADIVEEKNLVRQNFFTADLGKNKAEIMALKCSTLFDMVVRAVPKYIEDAATLADIISICPDKIPFIIGCVDNNATRVMLHDFICGGYQGDYPLTYLDAGNEEFSGQVALCYKVFNKKNRLVEHSTAPGSYIFNLPDITDHHPEMLSGDDSFASDLSCAERAVSNPQALTANNEAATILFQMICNCLRGKIDYHYVAFDTLTSNRRVVFNTASVLKSYGVSGGALLSKRTPPPPSPDIEVVLTHRAEATAQSAMESVPIETSTLRDLVSPYLPPPGFHFSVDNGDIMVQAEPIDNLVLEEPVTT